MINVDVGVGVGVGGGVTVVGAMYVEGGGDVCVFGVDVGVKLLMWLMMMLAFIRVVMMLIRYQNAADRIDG